MRNFTLKNDTDIMNMYYRCTPLRDIARSLNTTEEEIKDRVEYLEKCDELNDDTCQVIDVHV